MTLINIKDKYIEIKGHSGYAAMGYDRVCAAISTLSQATYNYLEAVGNEVDIESTDAYLKIIFKSELNRAGAEIVNSFKEMVKDLESQFIDYIKVEGDIKDESIR